MDSCTQRSGSALDRLSANFAVPLLRAFRRNRTHTHRGRVYENRGETEMKKKKVIVIHPHCIIYGVSLLSPSAGVRPRDPYSGDLTSRD